MSKTLSVSAIKHGTVIDHITPSQALRIIQMLKLLDKKLRVTVGLNLSSGRMGLKDLLKIENYSINQNDANEISIFAPFATINIIKNFEVVAKIKPSLPKFIRGILYCPNPVCITHEESLASYFYISSKGKNISLSCKYCEKTYDRYQVSVNL